MVYSLLGLPQCLSGKESACNAGVAGDAGLIPGLGRSPGEGHGNPLQYSFLENPMDRGAWWTTVHGVAMSQTRLKGLSTAHSTNESMEQKLKEWALFIKINIIKHLIWCLVCVKYLK